MAADVVGQSATGDASPHLPGAMFNVMTTSTTGFPVLGQETPAALPTYVEAPQAALISPLAPRQGPPMLAMETVERPQVLSVESADVSDPVAKAVKPPISFPIDVSSNEAENDGRADFQNLLRKLSDAYELKCDELSRLPKSNTKSSTVPKFSASSSSIGAVAPVQRNSLLVVSSWSGPAVVSRGGLPRKSTKESKSSHRNRVSIESTMSSATPIISQSSNLETPAPQPQTPRGLAFQLRAQFDANSHHASQAHLTRVSAKVRTTTLDLAGRESRPSQVPIDNRLCVFSRFCSPPNSPPRLVWDVIGAIFIVCDLITIPVQVFDFPDTTPMLLLDFVILLYWTLNMPATLTGGYLKDGQAIMDFKTIMLSYVKTWLLVDMIVLVPDWTFKILKAGGREEDGSGSGTRIFRIVRLMRMSRLLRVGRLKNMFQKVHEMIDSEFLSIGVEIFTMVLVMLAINHFVSCLWYHIGTSQEGGVNWITTANLQGSDKWYLYFTSCHWGITQFTPASMDVQPTNLLERLYAFVVVIFALVVFSYVVGSITGSLAQLRSINGEFNRQFWVLRRYLKSNRVPLQLSTRVKSYLEHAWSLQKGKLATDKVQILVMLSEQLQAELHSALAVPHLSIHPFFAHLATVSTVTIRRLSQQGIQWRLLANGDTLFVRGEVASRLYVVVEGNLSYKRIDTLNKNHKELVDQGEDWISEPALWLECWIHLGCLRAVRECELLTVRSDTFPDIIALNPNAFHNASHYARNFFEWIGGLASEELSDISQGEDVTEMVRSWVDEDEGAYVSKSAGRMVRAGSMMVAGAVVGGAGVLTSGMKKLGIIKEK